MSIQFWYDLACRYEKETIRLREQLQFVATENERLKMEAAAKDLLLELQWSPPKQEVVRQ